MRSSFLTAASRLPAVMSSFASAYNFSTASVEFGSSLGLVEPQPASCSPSAADATHAARRAIRIKFMNSQSPAMSAQSGEDYRDDESDDDSAAAELREADI